MSQPRPLRNSRPPSYLQDYVPTVETSSSEEFGVEINGPQPGVEDRGGPTFQDTLADMRRAMENIDEQSSFDNQPTFSGYDQGKNFTPRQYGDTGNIRSSTPKSNNIEPPSLLTLPDATEVQNIRRSPLPPPLSQQQQQQQQQQRHQLQEEQQPQQLQHQLQQQQQPQPQVQREQQQQHQLQQVQQRQQPQYQLQQEQQPQPQVQREQQQQHQLQQVQQRQQPQYQLQQEQQPQQQQQRQQEQHPQQRQYQQQPQHQYQQQYFQQAHQHEQHPHENPYGPNYQQWQNPPQLWTQSNLAFKFASQESVDRLTTEMGSFRDSVNKEMRKLRKLYERELSTEFPKKPDSLPLSSPEEVTDFETIPDDEYKNVVRYLGSLGGHTLIETANEILKNAMKDVVSPALTWHGRKPNEIALGKTRFAKALYAAVARNRNYPKPDWSEFTDAIVNALRSSKQRHRNSLNRMANRREIQGNGPHSDRSQHNGNRRRSNSRRHHDESESDIETDDVDTGRHSRSNQGRHRSGNQRSRQRTHSSSSSPESTLSDARSRSPI